MKNEPYTLDRPQAPKSPAHTSVHRPQDKWRIILFYAACIFTVLLPALPLFDLRTIFVCDWQNDVWMVNYFSEYFLHHLAFPAVINTHDIAGMAYPIFYGYLLFPLLAAISLPFDGSIALRLVSLFVWALQFVLFYRLALELSHHRFFAFTTAALVVWAIYPLTNIYNRGAMPEFIATGSMFSAMALWFLSLCQTDGKTRMLAANASVYLMLLAAGAHPITAVYGGIFYLGIICLTAWQAGIRKVTPVLKQMLIPALLAVICLSPWAYCTKLFVRQITVSDFNHVNYYPATLDSAFARLTPFPLPSKEYDEYLPKEHVGTKNLDTQVSIPLLLLNFLCLWRLFRKGELGRNRLTAMILFMFALAVELIYLSLHRGSLGHLGYLARSIQFAYRMVTYINMAFLTNLLLMVMFRKDQESPLNLSKVSLACLASLAVAGVAIKLQHGWETTTLADNAILKRPPQTELLKLPESFYGSYAYTTFKDIPMLDEAKEYVVEALVPPQSGQNFGKTRAVFIPPSTKWLLTNIQSFAWNTVLIDDKPVLDKALLAHVKNNYATRQSGKTVNYRFSPDRVWSALNQGALPVFFIWSLFTALSALYLFRRRAPNIVATATLPAQINPLPSEESETVLSPDDPRSIFHSHHYLKHNQRRQEHLASLNLDLTNKKVLELGAGIGDHTSFFLDRGCDVVITEARKENLVLLKDRFAGKRVEFLDLDNPNWNHDGERFDILYCYGILYHLERPKEALSFMAPLCTDMLLLETCVSFHDSGTINNCSENSEDVSQSVSGVGCRPTRRWIFEHLQSLFPHVYMPLTQPWHEEFPLDWTADQPPPSLNNLTRAIFVATRKPLNNPQLVEEIPVKQRRH